jgi:hypothetical protein
VATERGCIQHPSRQWLIWQKSAQNSKCNNLFIKTEHNKAEGSFIWPMSETNFALSKSVKSLSLTWTNTLAYFSVQIRDVL